MSKKKAGRKPAKKRGFREVTPRPEQSKTLPRPDRRPRFLTWLLPVAALAMIGVALLMQWTREPVRQWVTSTAVPGPEVKFVGSAECASCHERESVLWSGSHHQLAMQTAANSTVLGNFNNTKSSNNGITSTFFRSGSRFMVRTDGPDGALHDYEIKYTFGVYPLQQYLIEMQGGRLQALGIAWDSRPSKNEGQRWLFLYPGEQITNRDSRHWTGIDQTWNFMCADCHSTNVRKHWNQQSRTYASSYAEISVACEACHGPGSNHVTWARKQNGWEAFDRNHGLTIPLTERNGISWAIDPGSGNPRRSTPRTSEHEIQMCARCHSRRGEIHEDYVLDRPVGDDYRIALLDRDLYFPDGQIKGEVYEYGSFIQSRMFHEGVTCTDCHEPHSLKLRADGNNVCLQCHSGRKYDTPKHHFHQMGSAGARCVECHMPTRAYMVIDKRRDHSLRIPRPDLTVKLGTPNACTNCHRDKSAQWALDSVEKWYGRTPAGFQHFAEALDAGREGAPDALKSLTGLIGDRSQPAIARATALSALANYDSRSTEATIRTAIADASPLVRRAAARALSNSDPAGNVSILAPLLNDPIRAVRLEAAEVLAAVPRDALPADTAESFSRATGEYITAQELNADRPEAHMNLGLLYLKENRFNQAEQELNTALSLDPTFAPAAVNLADLYREQNRDQTGERVLESAIARLPNDGSLQHALGLLMVREGRHAQALEALAAAARLDPGNPRYAYVYAVALNDAGQPGPAIETLETSVQSHPNDHDTLAALVTFLEQAGDPARALSYAERLKELEPDNPDIGRMLRKPNQQPQG